MVPKIFFCFQQILMINTQWKLKRVRCRSSQQLRIDGPANKKSPDIKTFLKNDQNKEQLCDQLLQVWSCKKASSRIESCSQPILIVNVKGRAHKLTVVNGKPTVTEIHELYLN